MKKEQGLRALGSDRGDRGFTVLELLITIIILSVLLGIAIPSFSSWLPKYRLRGAARDIYSNLQLAKMTAVKDRAQCGILFNVADNSYQVISSGTDRTWNSTSGSRAGDDEILKEVRLSEYGSGIAIEDNITFQAGGVVFDSRGIPLQPTGAGFVGGYVCAKNNKDDRYRLGVLFAGVIVMARWTGSAWQQ